MPHRPYFNHSVADLEALVRANAAKPAVLGPIHDELTFRTSERAVQLRREVRALLARVVAPPAAPAPSGGAPAAEPRVDTQLPLVPATAAEILVSIPSDARGAAPVGGAPPLPEPRPEPPAGSTDPEDGRARPKARQVFRFLKDFAERNVLVRRTLADHEWTLRLADLPEHPLVEVTRVQVATADEEGDTSAAAPPTTASGATDARAPALIRVGRPEPTRGPRPPATLAAWVRGEFDDPDRRPALIEVRPRVGPDGGRVLDAEGVPTMERLADDPARAATAASWLAAWDAWAAEERPARAALRVFERLYELRGRLERDSERLELVLGDGRLRRPHPDGSFDHPVLLQRVELLFDAEVPEFRVVDADRAPELHVPALAGEDGLRGDQLQVLHGELERLGFHPLADDGTTGFLRRITALLGAHARFVEGEGAPPPAGVAWMNRDPVLVLRQRPSGLPAAFTRILEDLDRGGEIPGSVVRVVGVERPRRDESGTTRPTAPWSEPPDVLLAMPANEEQVQIARALDRHGAVLVQGPPGTGKSHTIANLIGHLVAQGQRVLVTSHTTKALRVLRDKVPERLRPLCVALLEQDAEGRAQLERSVRDIVHRLSGAQEPLLVAEIAQLEGARERLIGEVERLAADLRLVRELEYRPVVVDGVPVPPSEAAREVARDRATHAWLPGPLAEGAPLPLPVAEINALYASNAAVAPDEEAELGDGLPELAALPTPDRLGELVTSLSAVEAPAEARFWRAAPAPGLADALASLSAALDAFVARLDAMTPWQRRLVEAGRLGEVERAPWERLAGRVADAARLHAETRLLLVEQEVAIDERQSHETLRTDLEAIAAHLGNGGSLGAMSLFFRGSWKRTLDVCQVNGRRIADATQARAAVAWIDLRTAAGEVARLWSRVAEPEGLPPFAAGEVSRLPALADLAAQFAPLLGWWDAHWPPVERALADAGLDWGTFRSEQVARTAGAALASPFARDVAMVRGPLQALVAVRRAVVTRLVATDELEALDRQLAAHGGAVAGELRRAAAARDVPAYAEAYAALEELARKHGPWLARRERLARLEAAAPRWAAAIRTREGDHGRRVPPGDVAAAWRWRQLAQELERRARLDERELARQLEQRRTELRTTTVELVDRKAWLAQVRRTDLTSQQALIGWLGIQKRIGAGTGKRVPALQVAARQHLAAARDAVPVWIMPLARLAESFDPRAGRFDVVIVDEASQADVSGLLAFYAGRRIVVVGDHEQVSPSAVGERIDDAEALIAQHLSGIPMSEQYDGKTSIYDLARASFGGTIALREHFRCVPDIIDFSNYLAYDGTIQPLRDPSRVQRPHLVEVVVSDAVRRGVEGESLRKRGKDKVNVAEARMIAALVAAMCRHPAYEKASLGAITLVGEQQALEIQNLALRLVGAVGLERRHFAVGNPAQFQGDERDVMLLSMVDESTGGTLTRREDTTFKQRYNVAASRARDQLWLVHSLDPSRDLQPTDLRRRLIEHVRDPGAMRGAIMAATHRAESDFERRVIERLIAAGYRVRPQVEVGRHRIDLVVWDDDSQVAVECDGDRFHPPEQIPADLARQAVLERAGWRFVRIRGTRFYADPDETMREVFASLARLGVQPVGQLDEPTVSSEGDELRASVLRDAMRIMRDAGWLPAPPTTDADADDAAEPSDGALAAP